MPDDLFAAIKRRDLKQVAALLEDGADPNARQDDYTRHTVLHRAIYELENSGPVETVRLLLARGGDVDALAGDGIPLLMAVYFRQYEVAELLLKAGADPNARSDTGDTPLCLAAEKGDAVMASILLEYGAAKSIDEGGGIPNVFTPLGAAATQANFELMEVLLSAGANPDATDPDGETALQQAESRWAMVRRRLARAK
jgi:ankyrin repeat protein